MHNANAGEAWQQFLQKLATGNSYIIINLMPNVEVFLDVTEKDLISMVASWSSKCLSICSAILRLLTMNTTTGMKWMHWDRTMSNSTEMMKWSANRVKKNPVQWESCVKYMTSHCERTLSSSSTLRLMYVWQCFYTHCPHLVTAITWSAFDATVDVRYDWALWCLVVSASVAVIAENIGSNITDIV